MGRKRILQIIPTLDRGGAEKQFTLLCAGLDRARWDVHAVALTRSGPLAADLHAAGVPLAVVGKRWRIDPSAYLALETHMRSLRPDLVQTWLFAANAYGRAAALRCRVPKIVANERCVDEWKKGPRLWVDRWLARRTDRIVCNTPAIRDFYAAHGVPAEKFTYIPNAVPLAKDPPYEREAFLREVGVPPDSIVLGVVARLWPQKRLQDVIWAMDLLRETYGDKFHLLIAGDGPLRNDLARYAEQTAVPHLVHFLGVRHDVPRFLPLLDALWLSSEYEGQPNAVLEAMAAGIPVVATDLPGVRELVVPDETGWIVPVGDRAGFARSAQRLMEDRTLGPKLGAAGRAKVEQEFRVETMVARYDALYQQLLEG